MLRVNTLAALGGRNYVNAATWNPSDCSANITLSNGNLTSAIGTSGVGFVRSTIGKSSGKWYWEHTCIGVGSKYWIGAATATPANTDTLGGTTASVIYYGLDGRKFTNGAYSAYGAAYGQNDVLGFALDMDAGTLTIYKNNVSQGAILTGLTGTWYAARGQASDGTGFTVDTNFGGSAFVYSPPSQFNSGLF